MDTTTAEALGQNVRFELRFQSLFNPGRGLAFPCDCCGRVDMDAMSERARNNYLFARALMGRRFRDADAVQERAALTVR